MSENVNDKNINEKNTNEKEHLLDSLKVPMANFFYNLKRVVHNSKCEESLADGQFFLMFLLWEHGRYKVSDVSRKIGVTAGAITSMSDKLVEAGFVNRTRSKEDRRVVWLSLTEEGKNFIEKLQNNHFESIRERIQSLGEEDLKKIIEVFKILNENLNEDKE